MWMPDIMAAWIEKISTSSTAIGVLPPPTTEITPGVISTGRRLWTSKRQNTYPGKRGDSTTLKRSDHLRLVVYVGRSVSNPLPFSNAAVVPSHRDRIWSANHLRLIVKLVSFMADSLCSVPAAMSGQATAINPPSQPSRIHRDKRN